MDTDDEKRDKHLKSPDFLNVKQFPKIIFKSKQVKKVSEGTFEITGDLTLHGKTLPQTVTWKTIGKGKDPWGNFRMGGETQFTIERSKYGITYMPDGVGEKIDLIVAAEGIREK